MFAIVHDGTGAALAIVSEHPGGAVPAGAVVVEIDHPPGEGERWDAGTRSVVAVPDTSPNPGAFFAGMIQVFGHKRATALDRDYGAVWRGLDAGTEAGFSLALSAIDEMLSNGDITDPEYASAQVAWDAANLPRPA